MKSSESYTLHSAFQSTVTYWLYKQFARELQQFSKIAD